MSTNIQASAAVATFPGPKHVLPGLTGPELRTSYSQFGEDLWIVDQFPKGFEGVAVEVGAGDGIEISNTYLLERMGWTCYAIEPNPGWWNSLHYNRDHPIACAIDSTPAWAADLHVNEDQPLSATSLRPVEGGLYGAGYVWSTSKVMVLTLSQVLQMHCIRTLDVLSVDTEGTELAVLQSMDWKRWKPKAVVVEVMEEESPVREFMSSVGFRRAQRCEVNDLYLSKDPLR